MSLIDIIPGYREALDREQSIRDGCYLSNTDMIGDITVYQLTPRLSGILTGLKSPLIVGGDITTDDVLIFLWVIKVKESNEVKTEFFKSVMLNNNPDELMSDLKNYIETSYYDCGGGSVSEENVSYYSSFASIVDLFASEYGWREQDILDIPYRRLWQYLKVISIRNNPTKIKFNPSDRIKSEWLNRINA